VGGIGKPAPRAGTRHWRAALQCRERPGNWLIWCRAVRRGPLHLIHGGGLALFCPAYRLGPDLQAPACPGGSTLIVIVHADRYCAERSSQLTIVARRHQMLRPLALRSERILMRSAPSNLQTCTARSGRAHQLNDKRGFVYLPFGMACRSDSASITTPALASAPGLSVLAGAGAPTGGTGRDTAVAGLDGGYERCHRDGARFQQERR